MLHVSTWVCLKIVYPYTQLLMIIIPMKNGYFVGGIAIFRHVSTCFKFFTMKYPKTLLFAPGFAGVSFASCSLQPRARLGGQPEHVFAPLWADEQRDAWAMAKGHRMGKMGPEWEKTVGNFGKSEVSQMKSCRFSLQHIVFFRRVWIFVGRFI